MVDGRKPKVLAVLKPNNYLHFTDGGSIFAKFSNGFSSFKLKGPGELKAVVDSK